MGKLIFRSKLRDLLIGRQFIYLKEVIYTIQDIYCIDELSMIKTTNSRNNLVECYTRKKILESLTDGDSVWLN